MRRPLPVARHRGPSVILDDDLRSAGIDHGFNGQHHPLAQPYPAIALTEVGHLRLLMEPAADTVADELAHDRESGLLRALLNRGRQIAQAAPRPRLLDAGP